MVSRAERKRGCTRDSFCCCDKFMAEHFKHGRVDFDLQLEGTVHRDREGMAAGNEKAH